MDTWTYWVEKIPLSDGGQQSRISDINKAQPFRRDEWKNKETCLPFASEANEIT